MPYVEREAGTIVSAHKWPVAGVAEEYIDEGHADWVAYLLFLLLNSKLQEIKGAMFIRIDQGIRWGWDSVEPEHQISLDAGMREVLASWHQLLNQTVPATNPHGGFIKSNGVIFKGQSDVDIPDAAVNEIAEFAGLWVSEIARIAIAEELAVVAMDLAQLQAYDASAINWAVTWGTPHPDWTDDLVLYNP